MNSHLQQILQSNVTIPLCERTVGCQQHCLRVIKVSVAWHAVVLVGISKPCRLNPAQQPGGHKQALQACLAGQGTVAACLFLRYINLTVTVSSTATAHMMPLLEHFTLARISRHALLILFLCHLLSLRLIRMAVSWLANGDKREKTELHDLAPDAYLHMAFFF
jgi:hypothetical protein